MNGKKTLPLLVIASLMLSMIPSLMSANAAFTFTQFTRVTNGLEGAVVTSGAKGNIIAATGTGAIAGTTISIYWDDPNLAWNGVKGLLNSTTVKSSGAFDVWFTVPEATNGAHFLWFKDSNNNVYGPNQLTVLPKVSVSPTSGLPGDQFTLTLYGYAASTGIYTKFVDVPMGNATTNSLGTATKTITVPANATFGAKTISAFLGAVTNSTSFTVAPVITLSPAVAVVGQVIAISGRGFVPTWGKILAAGVTLERGAYVVNAQIKDIPAGGISVDSTGRFSMNVIIPSGNGVSDGYTIRVTSTNATYIATASFQITQQTKVSVTPTHGAQGTQMAITGTGFPQVAGTTVSIDLYTKVAVPVFAINVGTTTTAADGSITANFNVPAVTDGNYWINATVANAHIMNSTSFRLGTVYMQISATTGPTGKVITITGNGFTANSAWNATIGSKTLLSTTAAGLVSAAGLINHAASIPQMDPGTYTVSVLDVVSGISLTTSFTVTYGPSITFTPKTTPNDFNVSVTGQGFWQGAANTALTFILYNKTSTGALSGTWTLQVMQKWPGAVPVPAYTNTTGNILAYWIALPSTTLSKGTYYLNVTDASANAYKAQANITIGDKHIVFNARKASFAQGETVSFQMEHTFGNVAPISGSMIKIYDPNATLVFAGDALTGWIKTGNWYTLPYSVQTASGNPMTLSDDAKIGTWSAKWIDTAGNTVATASFTVTAATVDQTQKQIEALAAQITAVSASVTQLATTVSNVATTATAASNAATAASTAATAAASAATAASTAATAAGTKADAATAAANAAKTSADNAASAASGLTTLVYAAIGASLVAALAAIVALMQISRKIA